MLSFFTLISCWAVVWLVMPRSTFPSATAETWLGPLETHPKCKRRCSCRQVLQAVLSPGILWGVLGQLQNGALLLWASGALEEPDQEKHERSKGISACATSKGLRGPCWVSNLLNILWDSRYQTEKQAAKSTAGTANKQSHKKTGPFPGSGLKRLLIFLR